MKTLFRVLALGLLLTAFSALTFAQEKTLEELFAQFKTEAKAACGSRDAALVTGKTIVEKFSGDELNKDVIDYVKNKMADIEKTDPRCKLETRYNNSFKAKNWSEFMDVSKQLMAIEGDTPLGLDILLTHVSIGYDRAAVDKNDAYNNETMSYAKTALQRLDAGRTSKTGKFGVFVPFTTKEAAQSWMNYIIGWELYNKMPNMQKDALPYFYKSTTVSTEKKGDYSIYTTIGKYYFDEAVKLDTDYRAKRAAANNIDTDETKALLALARGTADRASDAFGRAYKIVSADPKLTAPKTAIGNTLSDLYKFRFNTATAKQADIDKYVNDLNMKMMADPGTPVTPVIEEVKPTTTSTTSTTTTSTTPVTTTMTTPKTTTNTRKSTTTAMTTTTTKTPVKKPVTKKKGTR